MKLRVIRWNDKNYVVSSPCLFRIEGNKKVFYFDFRFDGRGIVHYREEYATSEERLLWGLL